MCVYLYVCVSVRLSMSVVCVYICVGERDVALW